MNTVTCADGSVEVIGDDELYAFNEWYDCMMQQQKELKKMTTITKTNVAHLFNLENGWRVMLEDKGYRDVNVTFTVEPISDKVVVEIGYYGDKWECYYMPSNLRKCSLMDMDMRFLEINEWVREVPREDEARELKLMQDFAQIKERIAASNLSVLIKEQAESLMKSLTTNILPAPEQPVRAVDPLLDMI